VNASTTGQNTGTASFSDFLRASRDKGAGNIALNVTADPADHAMNESVTYTCTANVDTACAGLQNGTTKNATPIVSFGSDSYSPLNGASGSITYSLPKNAASQNITATFTISSI
jgi:hypothetical protein